MHDCFKFFTELLTDHPVVIIIEACSFLLTYTQLYFLTLSSYVILILVCLLILLSWLRDKCHESPVHFAKTLCMLGKILFTLLF